MAIYASRKEAERRIKQVKKEWPNWKAKILPLAYGNKVGYEIVWTQNLTNQNRLD